MYKSKLIQGLAALSPKEFKWFGTYIQSPFFNKNKTVTKLYGLLKRYYPDFDSPRIKLATMPQRLFPDDPTADEQKVRYAMSDLFKLLEEYLAYQEFQENDVYKKHLLLNAYDKRGLDKHFNQTLADANAIQTESKLRNVTYFFNQHLLDNNNYLHALAQKPRAINTSLQSAVDYLDFYYLANRLRYACAILNREEILHESYNNLLLHDILHFLSKFNLENVPAVSIYHQIAKLFMEPEQHEHYFKLRELLDKFHPLFPDDELYDMYTHALNYCNRKLNQGVLSFQSEMLQLYRILIEKEIIFDQGFLSPNTFKNIVTLALREDQHEFTEHFIQEYKDRIHPDFRKSTYVYNMANLHYFQKDFSKAVRLLMTVDLDDIYYHLDAKVLLLKTYFELEESEPFFSLVDAFSNYLKRNKLISDTQRAVYINFVKYARRLMTMKLGNRNPLANTIKEMQELPQIANLQWLMAKAEELKADVKH